MIDLESMIKSLQLTLMKRIFQCNNGAWSSSFLWFSLEFFGGLFFLNFIVIMTLKRYIFPLNSIPKYFKGDLSS